MLPFQCEYLLENYEEDIESWYTNHADDIPLTKYLCSERALKNGDDSCLSEVRKGDTGRKEEL